MKAGEYTGRNGNETLTTGIGQLMIPVLSALSSSPKARVSGEKHLFTSLVAEGAGDDPASTRRHGRL